MVMMFDIDRLSGFIATMPGERAEMTKANLVAIERELREGRAAKAQLAANAAIGAVCATIAGGEA